MSYKNVLESALSRNQFRLADCLNIEGNLNNNIDRLFKNLKDIVGNKFYNVFKKSIIRTSFFIEYTNPSALTDSTKHHSRWSESLASNHDIRFSSYECCVSICEKIVNTIINFDNEKIEILKDYSANSTYENELPIDYRNRDSNPFHCPENIEVFITPDIINCTDVRKIIKNPYMNPKVDIFKKIISSKIKVKAYLTDRSQTGAHQTNREKRWESHPENFQFAYRRDCNSIETSLILQVCMFEGANSNLVTALKKANLIPKNFEPYKCPITGDIIKYKEFEKEILNPIHGKSCFQVGHLNPLKSSGNHVANNIGWISENGNRIQGNLSMAEVDDLLARIYRNRPELRIKD